MLKSIGRRSRSNDPDCCVCFSAVANKQLNCMHKLCPDCLVRTYRCPLCRACYDNPDYNGGMSVEDVAMDATSAQNAVWSNETLTIEVEEGMQTYAVKWRLSVVHEVSSDHMFRVLGRFEDKHIMWSEFSDPHTTWSDFPNRHTMIKGIRRDLEELKRIVVETDLSDILPLWSNEYVRIFKDCDIYGAGRRCLLVIWNLSYWTRTVLNLDWCRGRFALEMSTKLWRH